MYRNAIDSPSFAQKAIAKIAGCTIDHLYRRGRREGILGSRQVLRALVETDILIIIGPLIWCRMILVPDFNDSKQSRLTSMRVNESAAASTKVVGAAAKYQGYFTGWLRCLEVYGC